MKLFLFVLVLVGIGIVGLGFSQEWLHMGSDSADGKSNVTFSVDGDKFQEDRKAAAAKVESIGQQIKESVAGPSEKSVVGTVVGVSGDQLTMANAAGEENSHTLPANVKVTCDGNECKPGDLKAGMRVRLTTLTSSQNSTTRIEALDKKAAFAATSHTGKIVSITSEKLVLTNSLGEAERMHALTDDVKVTCDGKACKAIDLKPGMAIRVLIENGAPNTVIRIEALEKSLDFVKDD